MSPRARRRGLTLLATLALALGLTQRGIWFLVLQRGFQALGCPWSRVGSFSVVAGYTVPASIIHAFPVTHGNEG